MKTLYSATIINKDEVIENGKDAHMIYNIEAFGHVFATVDVWFNDNDSFDYSIVSSSIKDETGMDELILANAFIERITEWGNHSLVSFESDNLDIPEDLYTHYLDDDNCIATLDDDCDMWLAKLGLKTKFLTKDAYYQESQARQSTSTPKDNRDYNSDIELYMEGCLS